MKSTIFFLFFIIVIASCSQTNKHVENQNFEFQIKYLTNDSTKFWETYSFTVNSYVGFYFASDGTCDEYLVDQDGNRQFYFYGDIDIDKPLSFKIQKDSLFIFLNGCELERCKEYRFKIIKLTQERLDAILNFNGKLIPYTYIVPNDQRTKPKFWDELYPNDTSKWPFGTY